MKDWIRKISVTLALAILELLLGILLLCNPVGFSSLVIVAAGLLLALIGAYHLYGYIRMSREEAAKTWKLASGAGILILGITAIINQHWMVQIMGTLTALYAILVLVSTFMKMQIAVDAVRCRRKCWYLMAVSFLLSAILAVLLLLNPFAENVIWVFTGIVLIVIAVLDGVYFAFGKMQ
ncbi:MAG: DUF308 domain-containing protein [Clostridia bacterium]|nr:DUF308 domain-containing protein [Clostridia bacterium]